MSCCYTCRVYIFVVQAPAVAAPAVVKAAGKPAPKAAKKARYIVDLTVATNDGIIKAAQFVEYFQSRIKVDGKAGALAGKVEVKREGSKVIIDTSVPYAKRYFKYLTRKYLAKNSLRDYIRVISSSKNAYELRYFKTQSEEGAE